MNEMDEMEDFNLSDKAFQRLKDYLTNLGWTAAQVLDLLDYITR